MGAPLDVAYAMVAEQLKPRRGRGPLKEGTVRFIFWRGLSDAPSDWRTLTSRIEHAVNCFPPPASWTIEAPAVTVRLGDVFRPL